MKKSKNILMTDYDSDDLMLLSKGWCFDLSKTQARKFESHFLYNPESSRIVVMRESYNGYQGEYVISTGSEYSQVLTEYFKSVNDLISYLRKILGPFRTLLVRYDFQADVERTARVVNRKSEKYFSKLHHTFNKATNWYYLHPYVDYSVDSDFSE